MTCTPFPGYAGLIRCFRLGWKVQMSPRWPLICWLVLSSVLLIACDNDAVVFQPTPLPPDTSPLPYTHPGGAFSLEVPRAWSVFTQDTSDLAAAHFSPPGATYPAASVGVIRLRDNAAELIDLVNAFQLDVRPDASRYEETERQMLGDGSWRLIGTTRTPGGDAQPINTFMRQQGDLLAIIELRLSAADLSDLERIANTLLLSPSTPLTPTSVETLFRLWGSDLRVVNVNGWQTRQGVYFITGEVFNNSSAFASDVPITVRLLRSDGAVLTDATDRVMGYGIAPGGYAPFSLRYGEGRPPEAVNFQVVIGRDGWDPTANANQIVGAEAMTWEDSFRITEEGHLLIEGTVINSLPFTPMLSPIIAPVGASFAAVVGRLRHLDATTLQEPVVTVAVFDPEGRPIAAAFTRLEGLLTAQDRRPFSLRLQEMGGTPDRYIVNIQAQRLTP